LLKGRENHTRIWEAYWDPRPLNRCSRISYRDGILSTRGAYILFPGDGAGMRLDGKTQNFFIRHPSAFAGPAAYEFPSVGAFDLCPGRDELQLPVLNAFLTGVLQDVAAGKPYREEPALFE